MTIKPGALRFNTDSMKLEIFRGGAGYNGSASMAGIGTLAAGQWEEIQATSPEVQTGGTRGICVAGYYPTGSYLDEIVYINIASTGASQDFGLLSVSGRNHVHGCTSDRTRGISGGGSRFPGVITADLELITIASTGNSTNFHGDLTLARYCPGVASNGTRGIFAGGHSPSASQNTVIDNINIQSTGVEATDFGDLTTARRYFMASMCSPTRAVFAGGGEPSYVTNINYITMSTQGNAAFFGNLSQPGQDTGSSIASNAVRGLNMGGALGSGATNTIEYLTLATLGDAVDFGDLSVAGAYGSNAASPTRCVRFGQGHPAYTNTIEYVQIMTTGNSHDFGDMNTQPTGYSAGLSNGHGGL